MSFGRGDPSIASSCSFWVDRTGTCIDPKTQIVQGKTVCVVTCQRSPEPVFLKWKQIETSPEGDFFVRNGPEP